jgi:hypothetical protein
LAATIYELERLRCVLCGKVFTAPAPAAGPGKYGPNVGVMLGLLRYGAGLPMYRLAKWQTCFGGPLPASTQWEPIAAAAPTPQVIYQALISLAAQAQLLHNDDTPMRVQSLRRKIAADPQAERTGIFTTGIVARTDEHTIALFFTGQNHAGENLNALLRRRATELGPPLHMCDALTRNEPAEFVTILSRCLLHGRRQFVDIIENFPEECHRVIHSLREVYRFEAQTRQPPRSAADRLAYHQTHSQPVMDELKHWMQDQLEQKKSNPTRGWARPSITCSSAGPP